MSGNTKTLGIKRTPLSMGHIPAQGFQIIDEDEVLKAIETGYEDGLDCDEIPEAEQEIRFQKRAEKSLNIMRERGGH